MSAARTRRRDRAQSSRLFRHRLRRDSRPVRPPGFDDDFESRLDEVGNHYRNERNPAFSRIAFFRNSNDHAALISLPIILVSGWFGVVWFASACESVPAYERTSFLGAALEF